MCFHLSIGRKVWGLFISSTMRKAYFFPFKSGWICMCAPHDNNNHAARRLAELLLQWFLHANADSVGAGKGGGQHPPLVSPAFMLSPRCVSAAAEHGKATRLHSWKLAQVPVHFVLLWDTPTEECMRFNEWLWTPWNHPIPKKQKPLPVL